MILNLVSRTSLLSEQQFFLPEIYINIFQTISIIGSVWVTLKVGVFTRISLVAQSVNPSNILWILAIILTLSVLNVQGNILPANVMQRKMISVAAIASVLLNLLVATKATLLIHPAVQFMWKQRGGQKTDAVFALSLFTWYVH